MPTKLDGRRAFAQFGFARGKLWGLQNLADPPILGQRLPVAGGHITANKLDQLGRTSVNIPDPDVVFLRSYDEGEQENLILPRFVGRAGELLEDAVGRNHTSRTTLIPHNPYASPYHIGGGYYTTPKFSVSSYDQIEDIYGKELLTVVAGIDIFSHHPMIRYTPWAAQVLTRFNTIAQPILGVCPLGEKTPGVYEFMFHAPVLNFDPFILKTDTAHMDLNAGSFQPLPAVPDGARVVHTQHICPIGRGKAAFLQVFTPPEHEPRVVYFDNFGEDLSVQPLSAIDPAYTAGDIAVTEYDPFNTIRAPLPANASSFARITDTKLVFIYFSSGENKTKLFYTEDEGVEWFAIDPPVPDDLDWTGHVPIGWLIGGPSLITVLGENAMFFSTSKVGQGVTHWYTLNGGEDWHVMQYSAIVTEENETFIFPSFMPTVIRPYVSEDEPGELMILVRSSKNNGTLGVYVSNDVGENWVFRGFANDNSDISPFGFNMHSAYVGTYDRRVPIIAGRPGMMELQA